ncbi:N4-gp56 family major capsid protein [Bradyrhizobium sp. WSM 1738]|uniref:N4-gp56 family major capsid protein n=1 Tax=Bradyrhizobium hereditatis TaxID=2821405 RepID=UPI001CE31A18|nr:N4-gp56 family major capsid protein [Bradyrhizobium hereditatis]MCA6114250.1 N4-gp56 family major capsid protein [Bradyrhizobium hereditatis]
MSVTSYGVNDALSNKLWAKKLNLEALKQTYFGRFMGEGSSNMIQVKTDFEKSAGDELTIGLRVQLEGDGTTEGQVLQGNEEALSTYSDKFKINELAHAVRVRNKNTIDAQRVPFNLRSEAKDGLNDWFSNRFDTCMANHLCGNTLATDGRYTGNNTVTAPSTNRIYRPGGATDDATINGDNTKFFKLDIIDAFVEAAGTASPMIRPIMVNGEKKYLGFLHDYQVTAMRTSTDAGQWLDIQKAALAGGAASKSPIYTGALGEYNNVVLHKWNRITNGISNAGAVQANTRRAVFCGAQAGVVGFGKEFSKGSHFKWIEELFDYERELGVSGQTVWGIKKSVFNSEDFGVWVATTYAAKKA